jgi:FAD:protein FMN transferase
MRTNPRHTDARMLPSDTATPPSSWQEISFNAMGTENSVFIGEGPSFINDMCTDEWVRREVEELEQCWSRFRVDSELNQFLQSTEPQYDLSDNLLLALDCAYRLWSATDGLFNARIRTDLERLGYHHSVRAMGFDVDGVRVSNANDETTVFGTRFEYEYEGPGFTVDLERHVAQCEPGVLLDLGGLGKGLCADLLAQAISDSGAASVYVSMGGDIRSMGCGPNNGGWDVPVGNPFAFETDGMFTTHFLADGAMAMSTIGLRTWKNEVGSDEIHHHLIDPRTGRSSASGVHSVAAVGDTTWWSEGVAKAALLAGPERAIEVLERLGVDGWVIFASGDVQTTALLPRETRNLLDLAVPFGHVRMGTAS